MRQYSAAIYADENLLLTEVLERIENDLPTIGVSLYSSSMAGSDISTATGEYTVNDIDSLVEEEILIVLSDPQSAVEKLKEFDGSVIDFTGTFSDLLDEVYIIEDPVAFVLNSLEGVEDAVATLPAAVFGKSGIDDMLTQTRELFAFSNAETKVFENRLAFNLFFSDPDQGFLSGYRQKLKQDTGVDADVRMIAVSTGFVLDVYFKKDVKGDFTFAIESEEPAETLADIISQDAIVTTHKNSKRASFAGDYIHVIVRQIIDSLKDITGED